MKCTLKSFLYSFLFFGTVVSFCSPALAKTNTIARFSSEALRILLVENEQGLSIALRLKELLGEDAISVSFAENPNRAIIDIPVAKDKPATDRLSLQHPLLREMRIGAHPGKTRIVLDLSGQTPRSHSISTVAELETLVINFNFSRPLSTVAAATAPPAAKEKNILTPALDRSAAVEKRRRERARLARAGAYLNRTGVIVHRGEPQSEENSVVRAAAITQIEYSTSKDSDLDALVLEIDNIQGFELLPLSEGNYELRVNDAALDTALPENHGVGFIELQSRDEAQATVIEIRVKQGVQLAAVVTPGTLVLRATK